ncbi:MAG: ABC transporter substrate-binding protein [Clostridia bacterium]|nr:ABC transporter substrate-binding protein [Clostridia bacterium]
MKKLALLLVMLFTSMMCFVGCGDNSNKIRLSEVTHSIFYAPLYIAINEGYFEEEGLEVELTNGNGSDTVMTAVLSGHADIGLAGPETAIYAARQGDNTPKVFGQLTACDGSFLVSRVDEPDFEITDLAGKEVLAGRTGGMPAMTLQYALHLAGLEAGEDYTLNLEYSFGMMVGAFEGNKGDYCTIFEPTASDYEASGKGYIVASIGELGGNVPYTGFIATEKFLSDKPEQAEKFLRAVFRGYQFLQTESMEDIVSALKPSFPDSSDESIQRSVESYQAINAWATTPVLNANDYNHLQEIIRFAGELEGSVAFNKVVDNTIAQKIATELGL